jgi:hypothetical protein
MTARFVGGGGRGGADMKVLFEKTEMCVQINSIQKVKRHCKHKLVYLSQFFLRVRQILQKLE